MHRVPRYPKAAPRVIHASLAFAVFLTAREASVRLPGDIDNDAHTQSAALCGVITFDTMEKNNSLLS
jgi:hypothetical protein